MIGVLRPLFTDFNPNHGPDGSAEPGEIIIHEGEVQQKALDLTKPPTPLGRELIRPAKEAQP